MNEIITVAAFRKLIGKTAGHAYLLFGGEEYLKAHALRSVREDVCPDPAFGVFNDITIDVADYTAEGLINAMSAPPMMSVIFFSDLRLNDTSPTASTSSSSRISGLIKKM